jgi:hypothetical protein
MKSPNFSRASLLPFRAPPNIAPCRDAAQVAVSHSCKHLKPLGIVLLLMPLTQASLFAQQGWNQDSQYGQNQFPAYPQQQQPYAGQGQYSGSQYQYQSGQYPDPGEAYDQSQQPAQFFAPEQLEQLVAPIALYPDTLIAQILAAATYPAQVVAADNWLRALGYASPEQIAAGANSQTTWDPSVKALTAFPQVLAMMDRDVQWATGLGNAYYNQPQDVLQTVQVLRRRAEAAGNLQDTPQQSVTENQGYIQVAPVNETVYVPAYNPWQVYGQPVSPYPGFSLLDTIGSVASSLVGSGAVRFGAGVALNAFSGMSFGWLGWALDWLTQSVLYHDSNYYSRSTSVPHWGNARGGGRFDSGRFDNRGGFDRGRNGFYPSHDGFAHVVGGYNGGDFSRWSNHNSGNYAGNRLADQGRGYGAYSPSRPVSRPILPNRPQSYARSYGYESGYGAGNGSGFYGNSQQFRGQSWTGRPSVPHSSNPQYNWRAQGPTQQRGNFGQHSFRDSSTYSGSGGRGFGGSYQTQHSGGFHLFGGGHSGGSSHYSYHAPKAPRGGGGGRHSGGGGRVFGGHHNSGHHH